MYTYVHIHILEYWFLLFPIICGALGFAQVPKPATKLTKWQAQWTNKHVSLAHTHLCTHITICIYIHAQMHSTLLLHPPDPLAHSANTCYPASTCKSPALKQAKQIRPHCSPTIKCQFTCSDRRLRHSRRSAVSMRIGNVILCKSIRLAYH